MAIRILSSENITGKLTLTGQQELLELTRGGASDSKWFFSADSLKLYIAEDTSASNNIKMTLTDAGNVGIGTVSPDQTGYGYKTLTIMGGTTAGYAGVLELLTPSTDANGQNLGIISFGSGGTRNAMIGAVRQSGNNNGKLQFWTSAGAPGVQLRMTIDADGQVGIGTDEPSQALEVHNTIKIGETGVTGGSLISGDSMIFQIDSDDSSNTSSYRFRCNGTADNGTELMRIQENGNVGIGTDSPTNGKFVIKQNSSAASFGGNVCQLFENFDTTDGQMMSIGFRNNNSVGTTAYIDAVAYDQSIGATDIRFSTYSGSAWSSNMVTFQHTGRVGIGTYAPSDQLHINNDTSNSYATLRLEGSNRGGIINFYNAAYPVFQMLSEQSGNMYFATSGAFGSTSLSTKFTFSTTGAFGVGTTTFAPTVLKQLKIGDMGSGVVGEIHDAGLTAGASRLLLCASGDGATPAISGRHYSAAYGYDIWMSDASPWNTYIDNRHPSSGFQFRNNSNNNGGEVPLMIIKGNGNVGIGTTSPTNYLLDVNGTVRGDSFSVEGSTGRIFAPSGAVYNGSGSQTGYLIVKLPDLSASGINNMMTGVIRVYDYAGNESFDVHFSGYWYSGYNWTNCSAWIDSQANVDRNFTVRWGSMPGNDGAGSRPFISIGDATSNWNYVKFSVINYEPGHSNSQAYKWDSGWNMDLSTTLPGSSLRDTSTTQSNNWARTGANLYYGSGNGAVGIGDTNPAALANRLTIAASGGTGNVVDISTGSTANSNVGAIVFRNSARAYCGQITVNGATAVTSYLSASDYRLKEDLQSFQGLNLVSNIKVYDYKWKSADERTYGVMAHELQEVLPQAVVGEKDAEEMQSVDYSKIVPLLVKAIQELKAEVELLKNK